jgi:hypothetical protein
MYITIKTNSDVIDLTELKKSLESQSGWADLDVTLSRRQPEVKVRGIDPTVLVAIVGTAGTGFGALIVGLFQFLQQNSAKRIVIQSGDERLEFPADMKPEEVDLLIEQVHRLGVQKITLD